MSVRANIPQTASTSLVPFLPPLHTVPGCDAQAAVVHGRRRNAQPAIYVSFPVFLSRDFPELRHRGRGDLWWSRATVLMLVQSLFLSHLDMLVWMMDIDCWFRSRDVVMLYPSCSVSAGSCVQCIVE